MIIIPGVINMYLRTARVVSIYAVKGRGYECVTHVRGRFYSFVVNSNEFINLHIKSNGESVYEHIKYEIS
jgi:hypothetical protein